MSYLFLGILVAIIIHTIFRKGNKDRNKIHTKQDIKLPKDIKDMNFSKEIIELLEAKTGKKADFLYVKRWFPDEERNGKVISYSMKEVKENGISARAIAGNTARKIVHSLYEKLNNKNYLVFLTNRDFDYENHPADGREVLDIAIIKGKDPYEIIKLINTNGQNCNRITNEVVINKLKEWEKFTKFRIRVVDNDYIEAEISRLPSDIDKFAKEIFSFAPDVVDQGAGTLEELKQYIKIEKYFWLWWD